jgi:prepilin-type N-terminal cleavage/methylation domain-containing protein
MKRSETTRDNRGFSLIELLIALSLFSVGFMAVTAGIIAGLGTDRTTVLADQAVFWGQELTETLAGIPLTSFDPVGASSWTLVSGDEKAEVSFFGARDEDGDGRPDFLTIGLKVWIKQGDDYGLRLEHCYRRAAIN